jgi:hypothetical protein
MSYHPFLAKFSAVFLRFFYHTLHSTSLTCKELKGIIGEVRPQGYEYINTIWGMSAGVTADT